MLTGKQNRHLRSLGHHLEPLVQIGKHGLTDAVETAVRQAVATHELVKVRVGTECPEGVRDCAERTAAALHAELAQVIGRTFLLYRRHPKKPKIELPGAGKSKAKDTGKPKGKGAGKGKGAREPTASEDTEGR